MILNNQNKIKRLNLRIDNKSEKKGDKLYFNGKERSELVKFSIEGLFIKNKSLLILQE